MQGKARQARPVSPHLQIYRFHILMAGSIIHRMTGAALSLGLVALAWWLTAAMVGDPYFSFVDGLARSIPGRIALFGWSWCFFYHLCNGIRHLVWDSGHGFDLALARRTGWAVFALSAVLTLAAWALAWLGV
jgi:succinate dehydrogenase / fumarate reductase cytochrome b subunit